MRPLGWSHEFRVHPWDELAGWCEPSERQSRRARFHRLKVTRRWVVDSRSHWRCRAPRVTPSPASLVDADVRLAIEGSRAAARRTSIR